VWTTHKFRTMVTRHETRPKFSFEVAPGAAAATWRF
jgi:hypothetical protein